MAGVGQRAFGAHHAPGLVRGRADLKHAARLHRTGKSAGVILGSGLEKRVGTEGADPRAHKKQQNILNLSNKETDI